MSADEYRTLRLTPLGRDVMAGRVTAVTVALPVERTGSQRSKRRKKTRAAPHTDVQAGGTSVHAMSADAKLVDALRTWRLDEARRRGIAPFIILHDRTLMAIASVRPRNVDALLDVPGIGPAKCATYGQGILEALERVGG